MEEKSKEENQFIVYSKTIKMSSYSPFKPVDLSTKKSKDSSLKMDLDPPPPLPSMPLPLSCPTGSYLSFCSFTQQFFQDYCFKKFSLKIEQNCCFFLVCFFKETLTLSPIAMSYFCYQNIDLAKYAFFVHIIRFFFIFFQSTSNVL